MWDRRTPLTQHFQLRNIRTILDRVVELRPNHILISGDLTNYAQDGQFKQIYDQLLQRQGALTEANVQGLDSNLWTILPGNHDVTTDNSRSGSIRPNLGMFFKWFGTTYSLRANQSYDAAFPLGKLLRSPNGKFSVRLIGLDSNVDWPVWVVGYNARGRIDKAQLEELSRVLSDGEKSDVTLVSLHHHPIVVPELISETDDHFLSLDEADGRKLVPAVRQYGR